MMEKRPLVPVRWKSEHHDFARPEIDSDAALRKKLSDVFFYLNRDMLRAIDDLESITRALAVSARRSGRAAEARESVNSTLAVFEDVVSGLAGAQDALALDHRATKKG